MDGKYTVIWTTKVNGHFSGIWSVSRVQKVADEHEAVEAVKGDRIPDREFVLIQIFVGWPEAVDDPEDWFDDDEA